MTVISQPRVDHLAIARRYVASQDDWPLAPRFDPNRRWYHRLASHDDSDNDSEYEVWLLTWLPGQGTDLHDHGGSAGAFVVVSGSLTERTVANTAGATVGAAIGTKVGADRARLVDAILAAGTGRWFGAHHVHQITNDSDRPAVSVHVYGPALRSMTRYALHDDRLRIVSVDRAGVAW